MRDVKLNPAYGVPLAGDPTTIAPDLLDPGRVVGPDHVAEEGHPVGRVGDPALLVRDVQTQAIPQEGAHLRHDPSGVPLRTDDANEEVISISDVIQAPVVGIKHVDRGELLPSGDEFPYLVEHPFRLDFLPLASQMINPTSPGPDAAGVPFVRWVVGSLLSAVVPLSERP